MPKTFPTKILTVFAKVHSARMLHYKVCNTRIISVCYRHSTNNLTSWVLVSCSQLLTVAIHISIQVLLYAADGPTLSQGDGERFLTHWKNTSATVQR